jgi:ADP-ribose pyrophosphatase
VTARGAPARRRRTRRAARGFALLRDRRLLRSRVYRVHEQEWRGPDGRRFTRDVVVHPGAVAVLAEPAPGRVLLIRQFRVPARGWLLEIPAGTLEAGETPLACARRELIEETGFRARRWRKLGAVWPVPGYCTERIHLYRAWSLEPARAACDEDEHIRVVEMTVGEVSAAVRSGRLADGKSLAALLLSGLLR